MSREPTASYASIGSLDLNSVAVVHQTELEGSGDVSKSEGDSSSRVYLSGEEDKNVRAVEEEKGNGEGVESKDELKIKADSPKADDADKSDAKHLPGDANLVREELFSDDIDSDEVFKKDDSCGEAEEQVRESGFSVCDMVWGKVRSHPWWPGQICDPSSASEMALRHQKKDHYLVAYFGDKTFAWNDKSRLKPFESLFSQMRKQSSLDEFVDAVDEALGEVARRTEIGMTCGCIAHEFIADLKHQMVENAGIKEGTYCPTLDRCVVASSFDPSRLIDYLHELAQFPFGDVDKLEFVIVNAQVKAIYMSRGYSELPEICFGGGLSQNEEVSAPEREEEAGPDDVECDKDAIILNDTSSKEKRRGRGRPPGKKKAIEEDGRRLEYKNDVILSNDASSKEKRRGRGRPPGKKKAIEEDGTSLEYKKDVILPDDTSLEYKKDVILPDDTSSQEKRRGRGRPPGKKKAIEEYKEDGILSNDTSSKEKKRGRGRPPGKKKAIEEDGRKQRSLPELMRETADLASLNGENDNYGVKAASKSSNKKHMISDPDSVDGRKGKKKKLNSLGDLGSMLDFPSGKRALKIGQQISRVANEMKISHPIFEHNVIELHKGKSKTNGPTSSVHGDSNSPRRDAALMQDYPPPSEMLSQLCFAAKGPTKAHRFQSNVGYFFVNWRDSHVPDSLDDDELLNQMESKSSRKKIAESDLVPVEVKFDYLHDSYWSDVIFEENPKKESPSGGRKRNAKSKTNQTKKTKAAGISSVSSTLEPTLNTSEHVFDGSTFLSDKQQEEEKLLNLSDDKTVEECNPAALILSFSDPDGLPSESDLIMMFSRYGPLKEAETEVSRKSRRASVMFKRGVDAEVAFSSAGKFSAFGPKLVSYTLRYASSSSPVSTPKKDTSPTKVGTSVLPDSGVVPTDGKA